MPSENANEITVSAEECNLPSLEAACDLYRQETGGNLIDDWRQQVRWNEQNKAEKEDIAATLEADYGFTKEQATTVVDRVFSEWETKHPSHYGQVSNGEIRVSRTYKKSGKVVEEDGTSETIPVKTFAYGAPICSVTHSARRTINLGNFESLQIGIEVEVPCYKEELNEALAFSEEFVDQNMGRLVGEAAK